MPVIGRFSFGGGDPYVSDTPDAVRGLGLQFSLPDGEEWRMAMVNLPVFPFNTPQAFYDNLIASKPDPNTHKARSGKNGGVRGQPSRIFAGDKNHQKPSIVVRLRQQHFLRSQRVPFHRRRRQHRPPCAGRWRRHSRSRPQARRIRQADKNYLFDALIASIHQHPLQWHLILTVGQPGDRTDDATIPWPEGREQVDAGTLTIDSVESEETSPRRDINFDPLVLPAGIAPSDDPLLSARSAIYSQSFTRRAGEKKEPSAITPSDVRK